MVQYLYKETTPEQNAAIEKAKQRDGTLREKFEVIKKAHARFEKFKLSFRVEMVLNLLKYGNKETVSQN
ncbi:hypothetical protein [Hydrotalea sp.]|uniref:hypothetical protein n=1 Tax=Hydrotalea sp. TaxID=2881279 RepID=UPI003D0B1236